MKYKDSKIIKNLNLLSPDKQIEWVAKETEKVLKRLPTLKKELKVYDDRSSELYNLTPEEVKLFSKVYSQSISQGNITPELKEYLAQLEEYGEKEIGELTKEKTNIRIDSFLYNLKQVASEEEYIYTKNLIDNMSEKEKEMFTKSKYFFDTGNLGSTNFVKFIQENGVSVATAKLEGFLNSIRKEKITEGKYFEQGVTRVKLGRPRKRGRKKK